MIDHRVHAIQIEEDKTREIKMAQGQRKEVGDQKLFTKRQLTPSSRAREEKKNEGSKCQCLIM